MAHENYSRAKLLKAYSLSASILLTSSLSAQIIYTDVDPDSVLAAPNEIYRFDFDVDGNVDMNVVIATTMVTVGGADVYGNFALAFGYGAGAFAGASQTFGTVNFRLPFNYSAGQMIGPGSDWHSNTAFGSMNYFSYVIGGSTTYTGGYFQNSADAYLGIRFEASGGTTHYGWIRLDVGDASDSNFVSVKDYAYESQPDTPIAAGDVGTPPSGVSSPGLTDLADLADQINIYSTLMGIQIDMPISLSEEAFIQVFSLDGKMAFGGDLPTDRSIPLNANAGIYSVRVETPKGWVTRKVYWSGG